MRFRSICAKFASVSLALLLFFITGGMAKTPDKFLIRVHLFQAAFTEGQTSFEKTEVLTTTSRPELAALKDKATGPEEELTAAVMDALLEIYDLNAINDLFLHEKPWTGQGRPLMDDFVFGKLGPFRIKIEPRTLPTRQIALRLDISKGNASSAGLETILRQELNLTVGDPIVISSAAKDGIYFAMVLAATGNPEQKKPGSDKGNEKEIEIVPSPNPIKRVQPSYPEVLRRRNVRGEVGLQITINEKGNVIKVDVIKPIHPYLDYTAVQAVRQWTFEPVLHRGKPRSVAFRCGYNFDPSSFIQEVALREEPPAGPMSGPYYELPMVLERCGEYCQKLTDAVFEFVCQETIKETRYSLLKDLNWGQIAVGPKAVQIGGDRYIDKSQYTKPSNQQQFQEAAQAGSESDLIEDHGQFKPNLIPFQIMDPKETLRNSFVCDYQIIRKAGQAGERRIILKQNGRGLREKTKTLEDKRFSGLSPLFAPLRVIAKDRQERFDYSMIADEKVQGKRAFVIKAVPKSGDEDGVWSARIWVDAKSFQIRKCEIEGVPIEGYEDVLVDCVKLNIRPSFIVTHEYKTEKNGVLFPDQSMVHAGYPVIGTQALIPKIDATLNYSKYKYFTVDTSDQVIK